jgi:hypothetical protein
MVLRSAKFRIVCFSGACGWFCAFLCLLSVLPASAYDFSSTAAGTCGFPFLEVPLGCRTAALGNAGAASDNSGPEMLFWNPAGIGPAITPELLLSHNLWWDDVFLDAFGYIQPFHWKDRNFTLGGLTAYRSVPSFDLVDAGQIVDRVGSTEIQTGLALATHWKELQSGIEFKWAYQRQYNQTDWALAADAGVWYQSTERTYTWGASVQNLGFPNPGSHAGRLPIIFRLAGTYAWNAAWFLNPHDQSKLYLEADFPQDDDPSLHAGMDYRWQAGKTFAFSSRIGFDQAVMKNSLSWGGLTAGLGLTLTSLQLDYALVVTGALGLNHQLQVSWALPSGDQALLFKQHYDLALLDLKNNLLFDAQKEIKAAQTAAPDRLEAAALAAEIDRRLEDTMDPRLLFNQACFALEKGRYAEGRDMLRKLLLLQPEHAEAKKYLAQAEAAEQKRQDALFQSELNKRKLKAVSLGRSHMKSEAWLAACSAWKQVLQIDRNNAEAKSNLNSCKKELLAQAEAQLARNDFEGSFTLSQSLDEYFHDDAQVKQILDRSAKALRAHNQNQGEQLFYQAMSAYSQNDRAKAYSLLQQARQINPEDVRILRALERLDEEQKNKKPEMP